MARKGQRELPPMVPCRDQQINNIAANAERYAFAAILFYFLKRGYGLFVVCNGDPGEEKLSFFGLAFDGL